MSANMGTPSNSKTAGPAQQQTSWTPMLVIALAQIILIFNVSTLQVSIEGIASSFNTSATTIGSAIVAYALTVAGLILLGARVAQMLGSRRVFRASVALFGAGMAIMALSPGVITMIIAQVVAGVAAAALVPTLVVLVADNYQGEQQEKALGWLGGAPAIGIVLAFLIAGSLATWVGWRFMFGLLVVALAAGIYKLGEKFSPTAKSIRADRQGGCGARRARDPVHQRRQQQSHLVGCVARERQRTVQLVGYVAGADSRSSAALFLGQAFITWSRKRQAAGEATLVCARK